MKMACWAERGPGIRNDTKEEAGRYPYLYPDATGPSGRGSDNEGEAGR